MPANAFASRTLGKDGALAQLAGNYYTFIEKQPGEKLPDAAELVPKAAESTGASLAEFDAGDDGAVAGAGEVGVIDGVAAEGATAALDCALLAAVDLVSW